MFGSTIQWLAEDGSLVTRGREGANVPGYSSTGKSARPVRYRDNSNQSKSSAGPHLIPNLLP